MPSPTASPTLSAADRRLATAGVTLAIGTPILRAALRAPHGSSIFLRRTLALQTTWALGAALIGRARPELQPDTLVRPAVTAAGAAGVFVVGGTVVRRIPWLRDQALAVLDHQRQGPTVLVMATALSTGVAEEMFFRGSLYDVLAERTGRPLVASTVAYTAATASTGNPLLTFAAAVLGSVCGVERRVSGSSRGPAVLHVLWSAAMILVLPRVLTRRTGKKQR